jgi:predicted glutamine amidotransferase
MILAIGKTKLGPLIDGLILMAEDRNEKHENNLKGSWKHGDGWGIAYLSGGKWKLVKSGKACYDDKGINALRKVSTDLAVLHARKGWKAKAAKKNSHPFKHDGWMFCHNGVVHDSMDFPKKFVCKGDTDSERLFYFVLSALKEGKEKESIRCQLGKLKKFTATNFILSSPQRSFVCVNFSEDPKYYTMKFGKRKGLTVVSSEKIKDLGMKWKALKNGTLLEIQKPI